MHCFEGIGARQTAPFNPHIINHMFAERAAGVRHRPTAHQLRDWMTSESEVPDKYHTAIVDTFARMTGLDLMRFRQNNSSSIRGIAHLLHATGAFSHRAVHFVDARSDIGDQSPWWGKGYAGSSPEFS